MKILADNCIWQYVCALGMSETNKPSMCDLVPSIMNVLLITAIKLLDVDPKEATTALSTYLKLQAQEHQQKNKVQPVVENEGSAREENVDDSGNGQMIHERENGYDCIDSIALY